VQRDDVREEVKVTNVGLSLERRRNKGCLRWNSWEVVVAACSGTSREEMVEATCGGQYLNEAS